MDNLVILNPDWLGQRIFGPILAPEDSVVPQFNSVTGLISLREIKRVYSELDPLSVIHLMEHFELCRQLGNGEMYEFPLLMKMEPVHGLWEKEPNLTVYAGLRLQTSSNTSIFSPSLFPRMQLQVLKMFPEDVENQEVTLWNNGLKFCKGEVEIYMRHLEPNSNIELAIRGSGNSRSECFTFLQQFYGILIETIHVSNPSTCFTIKVLSPRSMVKHDKYPRMYSSMEIFNAERTISSGGAFPHCNVGESLCDLLCCGCQEMEMTVKSAPYISIRDVPLKTRVELCRMLDPPDPYGRDWCLLALQLGVQEEVPAIDMSLDMSSPTDKLLIAWENRSHDTVVTLVDALRGIGREDVAEELVNGLSPFHNPKNSLVMKIGGVVASSYIV